MWQKKRCVCSFFFVNVCSSLNYLRFHDPVPSPLAFFSAYPSLRSASLLLPYPSRLTLPSLLIPPSLCSASSSPWFSFISNTHCVCPCSLPSQGLDGNIIVYDAEAQYEPLKTISAIPSPGNRVRMVLSKDERYDAQALCCVCDSGVILCDLMMWLLLIISILPIESITDRTD